MKVNRNLFVIKLILSILIIFSISLALCYRENIQTILVNFVANELDEEREKNVGEYNVVYWNDGLFQINHTASGDKLELQREDCIVILLDNIMDYKIKNKKLYVASNDGLGVVSENNFATLYINNYDESYEKDHFIWRNNTKIIYSKRYDDENILYIERFEDFKEEDKKVLNKIMKKE